jgi:hypothetical protein
MIREKKSNNNRPPTPPVASFEVQRAYGKTYVGLSIFQAIFQATIGVFKPGPNDPKTWYGRVFRFIGLIFLYLFIAVLIFVAVQDFLKGMR